MLKSTLAGRAQPTHSPTAARNPTPGIIYRYCSCMFYSNIWQRWSSPPWGGNCFVNHVCSQLFAQVGPKGVAFRKSVISNKRGERCPKSSWRALTSCKPKEEFILFLCGCEAVMHHWHSRPPQKLTKCSWRKEEMSQWVEDKTKLLKEEK